MNSPTYLFYVLDQPPSSGSGAPGNDHTIEVWRPTLGSLRPRGFSLLPFGVWWLFHQLRVFANRGYSLSAIYENGSLVHRTCVFPRYSRFPFMGRSDLQIGDVWTADSHRGRGLAGRGMMAAIGSASTYRRWWYVVESENHASIRLAEKVGFRLHGRGVRTAPWGCRPLGRYVVTEIIATIPTSSLPMAG